VDRDRGKVRAEDMVNIAMFGDAAGAAVLCVEPGPDSVLVRHLDLRLAGLGRAPGHTVQWWGPARRSQDGPAAAEDYKVIEQRVPVMSAEVLGRILNAVSWTEPEVDYLLPPQLSGRMTAKIVQRLGLPGAKEVSCVRQTGNTGNALPFLQLERLLPLMGPGQRAVAVAIESSKWIESGFAVEKAAGSPEPAH
jgi:3-oxoacyl-[acyl-carrier-protein] synthase-3